MKHLQTRCVRLLGYLGYWCLLSGVNLEEGVAGFGDTRAGAVFEFLKIVWIRRKLAVAVRWKK